jgi:hypothetical protein
MAAVGLLWPVLLVSGAVAFAFLVASALYWHHFDRIAGDVESGFAARLLRDGVALGGALAGLGVFGAAVDATATVARLGPEIGASAGPVERLLLTAPTGWLPWLLALGLLLVVGSLAVASADRLRVQYLD